MTLILQKRFSLLALVMLYNAAYPALAGPTLHMHVFDKTSHNSSPTESNSGRSPLVLHVFHSNEEKQLSNEISTAQKQHKSLQFDNDSSPLIYKKAKVYLNTGYRQDNLNWNTGMFTGAPNILSELTWEDIEMATINIGATFYFQKEWLANVDFTYGRIVDGKNQDSDYFGNNRTFEFSRSNNSADEGDAHDLSVHVGYRFPLISEQSSVIELRPLLGISYHAQNLKMVDGYQTVSELPGFTPPIGPFSGLDSSYDATWFGPWLGLESLFEIGNRLSFSLGFEYHYAYFDAEADWNLRSDRAHPVSFRHEAKGYGWVGRLNSEYRLTERASVNLKLNYQDWLANKDTKRTVYAADGTASEPVALNEINWDSFAASIGINYDF